MVISQHARKSFFGLGSIGVGGLFSNWWVGDTAVEGNILIAEVVIALSQLSVIPTPCTLNVQDVVQRRLSHRQKTHTIYLGKHGDMDNGIQSEGRFSVVDEVPT